MTIPIDDSFGPLLGEFVWHTITADPTLQEVSEAHFRVVQDVLTRHGRHLPSSPQILEVASYAHTTGYALTDRLGIHATLLDVSASTLKLGRQAAIRQGLPVDRTRVVAADFHSLPFDNDQFHMVYICSALHHTWKWQHVLAELMRVLAPGGLLLLENEPCLREFCFYRFRTNRSNNLTPFETKLDQLGLLRTVAEPYLGSRPETLFGMVENQIIPLGELKNAVASSCGLLELSVTPEVCMGPLEHEMVRRRAMDEAKLADWLTSTLGGFLTQAAQARGEVEVGLGFSLPTEKEIAALCQRAAVLLKALPPPSFKQRLALWLPGLAGIYRTISSHLEAQKGPSVSARTESLPESREKSAREVAVSFHDDPYREGLARLFGAGVKIVARKPGTSIIAAEGRLKASYQEQDGLILGFEPGMLKLLGQCSAFPLDMQKSPEDVLRQFFPPEDWSIESSSPGSATHGILPDEWVEKSAQQNIRTVVSRSNAGRIQLPLQAGRSLILLRCHGVSWGQPFRVLLLLDGLELDKTDVHQTETFLLTGFVETEIASSRTVLLKLVAPDGEALPASAQISLAYASAINL